MRDAVDFLRKPDGSKIAYRQEPGKPTAPGAERPGILFCGGFHSDMDGSKAQDLHARAAAEGLPFVRFDYRGHGRSDDRFEDGTIGAWLDDALAVLDTVCEGPQVIVGSSMGGWMALLMARARPERIAGLVLIAPAPDFPRRLMWPSLPEAAREAIRTQGRWDRPSEYSDTDYPITGRLIEESADHEILDGPPVAVAGPVHILQGSADETVPTDHALRTLEAIDAPAVSLEVVAGGDHRLSTAADLARLWARVGEVSGRVFADADARLAS